METTETLKASECMCPICLYILIEPVTFPCGHELCHPCFKKHVEEASLTCPMCRTRISVWVRKATKSKTLINQHRWRLIQQTFPERIENRLAGIEEDFESDDEIFETIYSVAEPGEVRKEYEAELEKAREDLAQERAQEDQLSLKLIQQLQEEDQEQDERKRREMEEQRRQDEELARELANALGGESPLTTRQSQSSQKEKQEEPKDTLLDKYLKSANKVAKAKQDPGTGTSDNTQSTESSSKTPTGPLHKYLSRVSSKSRLSQESPSNTPKRECESQTVGVNTSDKKMTERKKVPRSGLERWLSNRSAQRAKRSISQEIKDPGSDLISNESIAEESRMKSLSTDSGSKCSQATLAALNTPKLPSLNSPLKDISQYIDSRKRKSPSIIENLSKKQKVCSDSVEKVVSLNNDMRNNLNPANDSPCVLQGENKQKNNSCDKRIERVKRRILRSHEKSVTKSDRKKGSGRKSLRISCTKMNAANVSKEAESARRKQEVERVKRKLMDSETKRDATETESECDETVGDVNAESQEDTTTVRHQEVGPESPCTPTDVHCILHTPTNESPASDCLQTETAEIPVSAQGTKESKLLTPDMSESTKVTSSHSGSEQVDCGIKSDVILIRDSPQKKMCLDKNNTDTVKKETSATDKPSKTSNAKRTKKKAKKKQNGHASSSSDSEDTSSEEDRKRKRRRKRSSGTSNRKRKDSSTGGGEQDESDGSDFVPAKITPRKKVKSKSAKVDGSTTKADGKDVVTTGILKYFIRQSVCSPKNRTKSDSAKAGKNSASKARESPAKSSKMQGACRSKEKRKRNARSKNKADPAECDSDKGSGEVFRVEYTPTKQGGKRLVITDAKRKVRSPGEVHKCGASPEKPKTKADFESAGAYEAYLEEQDRLLALQLQADYDLEAKYRLNGVRTKGSTDGYMLRQVSTNDDD